MARRRGKRPPQRTDFCAFGASVLLKHLARMEDQIEGARAAEDIECIHKMRVSSRRLRAAMPVFMPCFKRKPFRRWLKGMRKVTKSLGSARDLDVQLAFLGESLRLSRTRFEKAGIRYLLSSHTTRRERIQPGVVRSLDRLQSSGIISEMRTACQDLAEEMAQKAEGSSPSLSSQGYFRLSERVDDLLEMEEHVYHGDRITEHHEMRIRAKALRYTMEIFAPLHQTELTSDLAVAKDLQDVLGEIHDLDVWSEYLPAFIDQIPVDEADHEEIVKGLTRFLTRIQRRRGVRYRAFVKLWRRLRRERYFEKLLEQAYVGFLDEYANLREALAVRKARIGLIGDIHGNLPALRAVLTDARERGVRAVLNCGDLLGLGVFPNEVIRLLREEGIPSCRGNFEIKSIRKPRNDPALKLIARKLTPESRIFLETLPPSLSIRAGRKVVLVAHGSPDSVKESLSESTARERFEALARMARADLVVIGHTHKQLLRQIGSTKFVNPGSVGRPYDGDARASYAMLSLSSMEIEHVRVGYDTGYTASMVREAGLPEECAQMLLRAIPLEAVKKGDERFEKGTPQDLAKRISRVRRIARAYDDDDSHSLQVTKLALGLFDGLRGLHGLGRRDRYILNCAGLLHDIGWCEGQRAHHKTSQRLILDDLALPFTTRERVMVSEIARYHRGKPPRDLRHFRARFSTSDQDRVSLLASLIRVADGLDYSHGSVVKRVKVELAAKEIILNLRSGGDVSMEEAQVEKKKDLLESITGRRLVLAWKPRA